jgi:hypothetical protein
MVKLIKINSSITPTKKIHILYFFLGKIFFLNFLLIPKYFLINSYRKDE